MPVKTRGMFSGDDLAHAKAKLRALTEATVSVRIGRDPATGKILYGEMPDNGIQLAATIKLIEFETGKAPATIDVQHHSHGDGGQKPEDAVEMLKKNPDLLRTMVRSYLDAAKSAQEPLVHDVKAVPVDSKTENDSVQPKR